MGFQTASSGSAPIAKTLTIYNVSIALANTEYSQTLSDNTKRFTLRVRDSLGARIQYTFVSGQSGTLFATLARGNVLSEEDISLSGKTIYFQSNRAPVTVEIKEWT